MANFIKSPLESATYSLVLNSANKVSGNNNSAVFTVLWEDFLPQKFNMYKVAFNFQTVGGNYKDGTYSTVPIIFSSATIKINFGGRSFSFDTSTLGPSTTLGVIQRDVQISTSASNTLSCYYLFNAPRTISRPTTNQITVQIFNQSIGSLLVDTNSLGTVLSSDMTNWSMFLEFIPIADDIVKTQSYD
jgi:hypothetical protein